ncbi:MAG: molecular chaperone HtpG [Candidatus Krumholzibacteriia bacterium]|jgi:molecular chaperone HtpG
MSKSAETVEFKAEMNQLMDIIIHSLYSHKEVFLRELLSNAADALDKVRFEGLTDASLLDGDADLKIKLIVDEEKKTLTISDNGIGMSRTTIIDQLGTIAKSGTKEFLAKLKDSGADDAPNLIGQFGVGFYASFMVADQVTVISRLAGETAAVKWESEGKGQFTLEDAERAGRGTDVILHLKEDEAEWLQDWTLRSTVKKFSDFVEHPIVMDVEKEDKPSEEGAETVKTISEEQLNSSKAIWIRNKSDVKDDEYKDFYKAISRDFNDPARWIHYRAEGTMEFNTLLFIPKSKPFDMFQGEERKSSLHLYVNRVQIMEDCETLLPGWLRFVKGVVDSSDLPLNVSRELLQETKTLEKIRKVLVGRVIKTLGDMRDKSWDEYKVFWSNFGDVIKEGVGTDFTNREKIQDLLIFESSLGVAGEPTPLKKIIENMSDDQDTLWYLVGESRAQIENSPYLEAFKDGAQDVLFLTEPIDEWMVQHLNEVGGKTLKAVDQGELPADDDEAMKTARETFKPFLEAMEEKLSLVKNIRLSSRLKKSAACLVADEGAMSSQMERMMRAMNPDAPAPESARVLELNPNHAAVERLKALYETDSADGRIDSCLRVLYDQALIAEGNQILDPADFAERVNQLMVSALEK